MKAVICTRYGPPEVLQIQEVAKPIPKDNEVLIKVHATSVTAGDIRIRSYTYARWFWLPGRFMFGITKPRKTIPGDEIAGEIESVGKDVKIFKKGDHVFGINCSFGFGGGNAEYKCLPEEMGIALKPANISWEEAATIPFGGLTALHFLRRANIKSGQKVLIIGASGGVGIYAVQIAKYFGAEVTGVCSTTNLELVRSLGADKVIDYTKEDFTKTGQTYHAIYDAAIKSSFSRCKDSLKPRGVYLTDDWPLFQALWTSMVGSKKIIFGIPSKSETTKDLIYLKELVEAGEIKSVVDRSYPLEQIVEAHRYVETGHKKGNVALNLI